MTATKEPLSYASKDQVAPPSVPPGAKVHTVGSLVYDRKGLWLLFFWLMWNDFTIMLMEEVGSINGLLMRKHGASFTLMTTIGTIGGIMGMWINPTFSTWSDRLRTRFGRRRPILMVAVPLYATAQMTIPFMPDLYHSLMTIPWAASVLSHLPINGEVFFLATAQIITGLFNGVVLAIFSYYYWDVVPGTVLGRFQSLARTITMLKGLFWSFFIFGFAEFYPKHVYVGVSLLTLILYLLSVWRVKEGEYPPPEPRASKSFFEPIRAYFAECYKKPYFLWIFVNTLVYQISNQGGGYVRFYFLEDLKLSYQIVGWISGVGQTVALVFGLLLGFVAGSLVDRLKPIRILPFLYLARAIVTGLAFVLVRDKISAAIFAGIVEVIMFFFGVAIGAVTVQFFPREKLGQYCSAQAFFYQTIIMFINPLVIGPFFDWIKFNRFGYAWTSIFNCIAALVAVKVYFNWKQRQADMGALAPAGA